MPWSSDPAEAVSLILVPEPELGQVQGQDGQAPAIGPRVMD